MAGRYRDDLGSRQFSYGDKELDNATIGNILGLNYAFFFSFSSLHFPRNTYNDRKLNTSLAQLSFRLISRS